LNSRVGIVLGSTKYETHLQVATLALMW
jgi:hypothetical protein